MHRLKCDVPRVMSAASSGNITPNTAALMPLTAWRGDRQPCAGQHRQQQAAQRQRGPSKQQQRAPSDDRRPASDPR